MILAPVTVLLKLLLFRPSNTSVSAVLVVLKARLPVMTEPVCKLSVLALVFVVVLSKLTALTAPVIEPLFVILAAPVTEMPSVVALEIVPVFEITSVLRAFTRRIPGEFVPVVAMLPALTIVFWAELEFVEVT